MEGPEVSYLSVQATPMKRFVLLSFVVVLLSSMVSTGIALIPFPPFGVVGVLLTGFGLGLFLSLPFTYEDVLSYLLPKKKMRRPFKIGRAPSRRTISYILISSVLVFLVAIYIFIRFLSVKMLSGLELVSGYSLLLSELLVVAYMLIFILYSTLATLKKVEESKGLKKVYKVAVVVPVYNEPPDLLEKTFSSISNLDYPNLDKLVVDDSDDEVLEKATKMLAKKYGFRYLRRKERKGFKAGALNFAIKATDADVIAVFDADHRPKPNFLKRALPYLSDEKVALVQAPQYFSDLITRTSEAAEKQQAVFYWAVAPGKGRTDSMFCVGTNFVVKRSALMEVGGFPEEVLTEDIAVSYNLVKKGYAIKYLQEVVATGESPPNLKAYFRQQARWAYGGTQLALKVLRDLFTGLSRFKFEYFVSAAWFPLMGLSHVFMLFAPILFVIFGFRSAAIDPLLYTSVYLIYFISWFLFFYGSVVFGKARRKGLWLGQALLFTAMLTWFLSAIRAVLRRPLIFLKTERLGEMDKGSYIERVRPVLPHLIVYTILIYSIVIGVVKVIFWSFTFSYLLSLLINLVWIGYFAFIYSTVLLLLEE